MTAVEERHLRVLRSLNDAYGAALRSGQGDPQSSLLLRSLGVTDNKRRELLSESSIRASDLDLAVLSFLKDGGYIRESDQPGNYTITARGIWEVESANDNSGIDRLISGLDRKYFDIFEGDSDPSDRERVILLTMAATRAFSVERSVDLQHSDVITEGWKEASLTAARFLASIGVVTEECVQNLFSGGSKTELPVSNLFRHTDALQGKTRRIFKVRKPQKYYLDVMRQGDVDGERLGYVFAAVLAGHVSIETIEAIQGFCRKLSQDFSTLVFPKIASGPDFSHPRFSRAVDSAIRRAPMVSRSK